MSTTTIGLKNIAHDVAKALGKGWSVEKKERDYSHYVEVLGPDGAAISISTAREKDRLYISGNYDDRIDGEQVWLVPYKTTNPSITVAMTKSAEQIAADITRRLLPDYLPLLADCQKTVEQHKSFRATTAATADRVAAAVGGRVDGPRNGRSSTQVSVYHSDDLQGQTGDITISGTGVSFDRLSVDADEAIAMLHALAAIRAAKRDIGVQ